jgi:hypothetical protein
MNNQIKASIMNEYKRWSKTEPTKDGQKSVSVREVENGFIIDISTESEDKYTTKTYISSTNPLKDEDASIPALDLMKEASA